MTDSDDNFAKLKYATEWQIEIGKVLQSFDPVLRPVEDMEKHGITMATVLLGISASVVGGSGSGSLGMSYTNLLILGAWFSFLAAAAAGSVQLHRISVFRETIRKFCHVLLGKESSVAERGSALNVMGLKGSGLAYCIKRRKNPEVAALFQTVNSEASMQLP